MSNTPLLYLDYNATAPMRASVKACLGELSLVPYNPSSIHSHGRHARKMLEAARSQVVKAVGCREGKVRVVFTASGTEANNLAIRGVKHAALCVSAIEHASVLKAAEKAGDVTVLPVDKHGVIDIAQLEAVLATKTPPMLVSVMLASNETGVIQPVARIAEIAHRYGALVHTDAVQACGRIPVDMQALGVDMLTLSSHKCGGPLGAAALVIGKQVALEPLILGGGQEQGYRAGTENLPAIIGFGLALEEAEAERSRGAWEQVASMRDAMEASLSAYVADMKIFGRDVPRLPNTSYLSMPGVRSETQLIQYDLASISVSSGSACSSGKVSASHVLKAMGVPESEAMTAIRVSLGTTTTAEEMKRFTDVWSAIYEQSLKTTSAIQQHYVA